MKAIEFNQYGKPDALRVVDLPKPTPKDDQVLTRHDLIVDCQNFRPMRDNKRALTPAGAYAMIRGSIPRVYELWLLSFLSRFTREKRKLYLVAEGPNKGLTELCEFMQSGKLVSVIDRTFSLAEVPTAMRYFGEGRHRGKIMIEVRSE